MSTMQRIAPFRAGVKVDLLVLGCASCGMTFAVTEDFERRRRDDHKTFYCPAGHYNSWSGPSEEEQLRKQLKAEQNVSAYARQRAQEEREARQHAEKVAQGYKGQMVRTKNRIAAGVCPCCSRSFQNVARHMKGQHPEYAAKAGV